MRLINVRTLRLEEFLDECCVEYAILSHRWSDNEVSFQDMQNESTRASKTGFAKIMQSCTQAAEDGYLYLWCDTCCINKESTAELSEAINSMFRWYQQSSVCYAYLADVDAAASDLALEHAEATLSLSAKHRSQFAPAAGAQTLEASEWFRRGWTLQELIAPTRVKFYDRQWRYMGSKFSLINEVCAITGIAEDVLSANSDEPLRRCSIAQRMSWASRRVTTRPEDMAYCLLGIFDVNMPMLYGEGRKAFRRLQEEIIKDSDDHSIFAWYIDQPEAPHSEDWPESCVGLLASAPAAFACSGVIRKLVVGKVSPFSMTNRGLSITLYARPFSTDTYLALLNCWKQTNVPSEELGCLAVFLRHYGEGDQYIRTSCSQKSLTVASIPSRSWNQEEELRKLNFRPMTFYVRQQPNMVRSAASVDAFLVSVWTGNKATDPRFIPFDTSLAAPSVQIRFSMPRSPIIRLRLAMYHDTIMLCFLEFASQSLIGPMSRAISTNRMKSAPFLDPFSIAVNDELSQLQLKPLTAGEDIRADNGVYVIKGDELGFEMFFSPFGTLRLSRTYHPPAGSKWQLLWHLKMVLNDDFSSPSDSFRVVQGLEMGNRQW